MNKKFYLVLSVKQIRRLAKVAERSRRAHHSKDTHCLVLENLETTEDFLDQIGSVSFAASVEACDATAEACENFNKAFPKVS